ncbi:cupin domain-containing protein [Methylovirgula sp. 4M-Z18]|uniref:cupin domain-containing protein n=1 Tax=Methylovirgula sp. 4M-Z18 TaxID=2293567 RepID=UPI000E2F57A5|nr:cupin domain-containing protein [Methylovirgula sp. 4M-Z18]RFB80542.1 cupin domain-containing protein [Methylovirgula sp. 4M-Z18]
MLDNADLVRINPADETFSHEGVVVRFLLTGKVSNGSIAAFEVTVPGSKRLLAPAHSHDRFEETIYGVEGTLTWTVDGHQHDVSPGQALCIPRGAVHRFDNNGANTAKVLCVVTPAAIGPEYFREAFAVLNAAAGDPPDRTKMMEIMLRHGLTPAPPLPQT